MSESKRASLIPAPLLRIALAVVPIAVVCFFASGLHDQRAEASTMTPEALRDRLQPVAHVMVTAAPAGAKTLLTGQQVYESVCTACHGEGVAGAPKVGNKAAWSPRIAQGFNVLVKHALEGYIGKSGTMPSKGGGSFEDVEVARAVAFMADKAGATFKEPEKLANK
jgi:cytochrome c5